MILLAIALAPAGDVPSAPDFSMLRGLLGLCLVLCLIGLLAFLLRRGVIALPGQRGPRSLSVETTLQLGDRRSLVIVNVEGRRMLLGLSPAQVAVLQDLGSAPGPFDRALDRASGTNRVEPS